MKKVSVVIIFSLLLCMFLPFSVNAKSPFTDIENHWSKEDALWAVEQGIMLGTSETEFSPEKSMSRGMVITALYRMDGSKEITESVPFLDVSEESYYYNAVSWGVQNKIINGTSANTFTPNKGISRQDFAVMLYRFWHYQNGTEWTLTERPDDFKEAVQGNMPDEIFFNYKNVSNLYNWYASDAIEWAVAVSIINGNSFGKLLPFSIVKRGEVAAMLKRYAEGKEVPGTVQQLFSIDPENVEWIRTTHNYGSILSRTVEDPKEIQTLLESINGFSYTYKRAIRNPEPSEYYITIYDTRNPYSYPIDLEKNGILFGDIYFFTTEESEKFYGYLPKDWLEKWFES